MKIQQLHCKHFGPYRDVSWAPAHRGLHIVYGENESGKTSLLEAIRGVLFGFTPAQRKGSDVAVRIERADGDYYWERYGKKWEGYQIGGAALTDEPANLWWHGLDRKTYEKIFGVTIEDLQGLSILDAVDVRTRFFGTPGGEKLSIAVKEIQKASESLFVKSANGKRIINCLLDELQQKEKQIQELQAQEGAYVQLQQQVDNTLKTEAELQESLQQWQEYQRSVDLVLHAWDTYKRAEEARAKMDTLQQASLPDQQAFLELDREITQCREQMQFWRKKEEGLIPENFTPQARIGQYAQEIEGLYQQLGRWEQLQKVCHKHALELAKRQDRLALTHSMCMTWRRDVALPAQVDWVRGEAIAQRLRQAQEALAQWEKQDPEQLLATFTPDVPAASGAPSFAPPTAPAVVTFGKLSSDSASEEDVKQVAEEMDALTEAYSAWSQATKQATTGAQAARQRQRMAYGAAVVLGIIAIGCFVMAQAGGEAGMAWTMGGAATVLAGLVSGWYGQRQGASPIDSSTETRLHEVAEKLGVTAPETESDLFALRDSWEAFQRAYYGQDVAKIQDATVRRQQETWEDTKERLRNEVVEAAKAWQAWLPEGANEGCGPEHFFAMKQEYDAYQKEAREVEVEAQELQAEQEALRDIEYQAQVVWGKLEMTDPINTIILRQLYRQLQEYRQNQIRYEQKEVQRRSYREEYDKAHCREKDLLLQQEEILQRNGFTAATEFRSQLISAEQYRQWETIYKQSKVQLQLLAPNQDTYDLMTRRLREGDRKKWETEQERAQEQRQSFERQIAKLYEERGQLQEAMRQLGSSQALTRALQERSHLEVALTQSLEDWATQVFLQHFLDVAQTSYEAQSQPAVIEKASEYLGELTEGKYQLALAGEDGSVVVWNAQGQPHPPAHWSSGLGDQIYLALRLSLARRFGQEVEALPIILDDILNRFDEKRQRAALRLLARLAQEEQIFVFTCLASVVGLARETLAADQYHIYHCEGRTIQEA